MAAEKDAACHAQHRQRLKNRFLNEGLDSFEEHNVLELLLFYSIPRKDTNEIAHRLINEFGSLAGVFDAPIPALMAVDQVGPETAALLKLIPDICRKYMQSLQTKNPVVICSDDAVKYLKPYYIGRTKEVLMAMYMNARGEIISVEELAVGGNDFVTVDQNKILLSALSLDARGVVLAHNHPKGFAKPSPQDINLSVEISKLLKSVSIFLCDHIIFNDTDYCCMSKVKAIKKNVFTF